MSSAAARAVKVGERAGGRSSRTGAGEPPEEAASTTMIAGSGGESRARP